MTQRQRRKLKIRLLKRRNKCSYCGISLTLGTATADHMVARSIGGKDRKSNVTLACERCNKSKGNLKPTTFMDVMRRYKPELIIHNAESTT